MKEFDDIKVSQMETAFKVLADWCTDQEECDDCPFVRIDSDGSGVCKFRLACGYPAYMLGELITGPIIES